MTHRYIDDPADVAHAASALADGAVVATAFGNFYAVVSRPDAETVRRVNRVKGRPAEQVGSVTTAFDRIAGAYDWARLDRRLDPDALRALMTRLHGQGPFGFRGPAAGHVPDHLTMTDRGVRTTQVIAPGRTCPSNALFATATTRYGLPMLYVTSANRSRHLTGATEEPAHWMAGPLAEDFAHVPDLVLLRHRDEAAARAAYPMLQPTSATLLSFHAPGGTADRPVLTVDRQGSMGFADVYRIARAYGFGLVLGPGARRPLRLRRYPMMLATAA